MTDPLHLLAQVNHLTSQDSASKLEDVAQQQKDKVYEKRQVRDVQEIYDKYMADGKVTFDELQTLHDMRTEIGSTEDAFWGSNGRVDEFQVQGGVNPWSHDNNQTGTHGSNSKFYLDVDDPESEAARKNKTAMEAIEREIDGKMDGLEDNEALLQFEIQMATSEMTNADANRGQAEKRLSDHRNEMRRNWAP
jgi:hypothetical protein